MSTKRIVLIACLCFGIFISSVPATKTVALADGTETETATETETETVTETETETQEPDSEETVRRGWVKTKSGKKYYTSKGKMVTGIKKIKKKWYFFKKSGLLATKTCSENGTKYYINDKNILEAYKKNNTYYKPNGTKMTTAQKLDYTTLLKARKIAASITTDKMTKKQKLKACFEWVKKKPYVVYRKFKKTSYWPATYAGDHFYRKGGDCHADASALAYLARAIGYTDVYVCLDCDGISAQGHSWAQINGLVYDPLFAQARGYKGNYAASYSSYSLRAITKVKVAIGY